MTGQLRPTTRHERPSAALILGFHADAEERLVRRMAQRLPKLVAATGGSPGSEFEVELAVVDLDGAGPSADQWEQLRTGRPPRILALGRSAAAAERAATLPGAEFAPLAADDADAVCWAVERALERDAVEQELEQALARYELASEATRDGLFDWDRATGQVFWSPVFEAMLGLERGGLSPRLEAWLERVHPSEQADVRRRLERFLQGSWSTFQFDVRVRHATRGYRLMRLRGQALVASDGQVVRLVGSQRDVTSARQREERLRYAASHDPLTGVANRVRFRDRLEHALERASRRPSDRCAVLVVDLDDFKPINDLHGHAAGDALLVELAHRMRACVRPADTVARLGGDEFGILLDGIGDERGVQAICERLLESLAEPLVFEGRALACAASIGFVLADGLVDDVEELLERADQAMYAAKETGGGVAAFRALSPNPEPGDTLYPMPLPPRPRELAARPLVELLSRLPVGLEILGRELDDRPRALDPGDVDRLADELETVPAAARRLRWIDLPLASSCVRTASALALTERALSILARFAIQVRVGLSEDAFVQGGDEFFAGVDRLRAGGALVLVDGFGRRHGPIALLSSGRADGVRLTSTGFGGHERSFEAVVALAIGCGAELVVTDVRDEFQALRSLAAGGAVASGPLFGAAGDLLGALASGGEATSARVARSVRRR